MIKVNKAINLEQLDKELNGLGLLSSLDEAGNIIEIGLADYNTATENQLEIAIENHVAIDTKAIKATARQAILDRLGLTAEELALLLG
jgi:hypothetical protein